MRWQQQIAAIVLILAAACGENEAGADVRIESPEDGASVDAPLTVEVSSSVPLGRPDSGSHFMKVFVDGFEGPTVDGETFELTDLAPGDHKITVTVFEPDGERALAQDDIGVTVTGGATGEQPTVPPSPGGAASPAPQRTPPPAMTPGS
ncbi:MAG TPA: hypothetical protein VHF25_08430 [Nitriliruptorales bacterium]|nr:hypothetical protein [Nitriliruptorales bacterium]